MNTKSVPTVRPSPEQASEPAPPQPAQAVFSVIGSVLVGGLVGAGLYCLLRSDDARRAFRDAIAEYFDEAPEVDEDARQAADLLGIDVDATPDQVRAALRARLAKSRIHPDQGGDGEEARQLIAAKNLLVERAQAAAT